MDEGRERGREGSHKQNHSSTHYVLLKKQTRAIHWLAMFCKFNPQK